MTVTSKKAAGTRTKPVSCLDKARKPRFNVYEVSRIDYNLEILATTSDKQGFFLPVAFTVGPLYGDRDKHKLYTQLLGGSFSNSHGLQIIQNRVQELVRTIIRQQITDSAVSLTAVEVFDSCTNKFKNDIIAGVHRTLFHQYGMIVHKAKIKQPRHEDEGLEEEIASLRIKRKQQKVCRVPQGQGSAKVLISVASQPRPMPDHINTKVKAIGGIQMKWVSEKEVTKSDVDLYQSRFHLPNEEVRKSLSESEISCLEESTKNCLEVVMVDHWCEEWKMILKYWGSTKRYVLLKWYQFLKKYDISPSGHKVEIWSFRVPDGSDNGKLGFALNFIPINTPDFV